LATGPTKADKFKSPNETIGSITDDLIYYPTAPIFCR